MLLLAFRVTEQKVEYTSFTYNLQTIFMPKTDNLCWDDQDQSLLLRVSFASNGVNRINGERMSYIRYLPISLHVHAIRRVARLRVIWVSHITSERDLRRIAKKAQKNTWDSNGIGTNDPHDTGLMLYQLSYETSLEAVGQERVQFVLVVWREWNEACMI